MFTKRTIKQRVTITHVDTASEALAVSLAEKAKVDMDYMVELTGKTEQEIYADLTGVIFLNPMHGHGGSDGESTSPPMNTSQAMCGRSWNGQNGAPNSTRRTTPPMSRHWNGYSRWT